MEPIILRRSGRAIFRYLVASALTLAAWSVEPALLHGQELRALEDQFYLGVGTHQGIGGAVSKRGYLPSTSVEQIKQLGLTSFRDDFPWSEFEIANRRWGFSSSLTRLKAQLETDVARPMLILGSGNPIVPQSDPPTTDEARRRFVEYSIAAAQSVATRKPIFELWNEWNISTRHNPQFDAATYFLLAQTTYPAFKQAFPDTPFVVGAIGDDPYWQWTQSLLQAGILKFADGISIHLYNHCARVSNRTAAEVIDRLRTFHQMIDRASGRADFPVYLTETGWPTAIGKCGVSEQTQADNMAQLILWASTSRPWLKGIWLYELKDSGTDTTDLEHNFGIYHFDNSPKPAACAVRDSWSFTRSSLQAEQTSPASKVTMIKINSGSEQKIAVWSDDPSRVQEIHVQNGESGTFKYVCGEAKPMGSQWIRVSSTPLLMTFSSITPVLEIRRAQ